MRITSPGSGHTVQRGRNGFLSGFPEALALALALGIGGTSLVALPDDPATETQFSQSLPSPLETFEQAKEVWENELNPQFRLQALTRLHAFAIEAPKHRGEVVRLILDKIGQYNHPTVRTVLQPSETREVTGVSLRGGARPVLVLEQQILDLAELTVRRIGLDAAPILIADLKVSESGDGGDGVRRRDFAMRMLAQEEIQPYLSKPREEDISVLLELLKTGERPVRLFVIRPLAGLVTSAREDIYASLVAVLDNVQTPPELRRAAVEVLGELGVVASVDELPLEELVNAALAGGPGDRLPAEVSAALAAIASKAEKLASPDETGRLAAALLAHARPVVLAIGERKDAALRRDAIRLAGLIGGIVRRLAPLSGDPVLAGNLTDRLAGELVAPLLAALTDPRLESADRKLLADALAMIGPAATSALPALNRALFNSETDTGEKASIIAAIGAIARPGEQ